MCNQISYEYIKYDLQKRAESSVNIVNYINDQKDSVEVRLRVSEKKIQGFQKQNYYFDDRWRKQHGQGGA